MEDRHSEALREIRQAHRCRKEVEELAQRMRGLSEEDYGELIEGLVMDGEDRQLGILLAVCAVNGIRIDPTLLASTLPVVEPLIDFALPYRFQDGTAVDALIQAAEREDISWERQALAGRIAAELAVRFQMDVQPVRKALLKLRTKIHSLHALWMIDSSLSLLEGNQEMSSSGFHLLDISVLLDVIRSARVEMGLDLMGDPVEDYLDWWTEEAEEKEEERRRSEDLRGLAAETVRARKEVEEKANELREKEKQLQELISKTDEERRRLSADARLPSAQPSDEMNHDQDTIPRLRRRIDSLKEEVRSQQEHRRRLRRQLQAEQAERDKHLSPRRKETNRGSFPESNNLPSQSREVKKVLVPEYAPAFRRACESLDSPVVVKALKASVGFAINDPLVWRRTKPLKRMPGFYRIRLEKDHRLMLHREAERKVEILDLIPRSQLETWIRHHAQ